MVSQQVDVEPTSYAFNVCWKLKGSKLSGQGSYICGSVFKLLSLLEQAEGITRDNVDTLIIHQHVGKGHTREVMAIENGVSGEAAKPRVNLPVVVKEEVKVIKQFTYEAYPAVSLEKKDNG